MVYVNEYTGLSHDPAISFNSKGVLEDIKSTATYIDSYSFFGVDFTVKFNSSEVQQLYRSRYKHFLLNSREESKNPLSIFYIITTSSFDNKPLLIVDSKKGHNLEKLFSTGSNRKRFKMNKVDIDGEAYYEVIDSFLTDDRAVMIGNDNSMIINRESLGSYTELIIFNSILSQIQNHFILHAGVVSWKEKGIILCGDANSGQKHLDS